MTWVSEGRSRQRAAFMLCKAVGDGGQGGLLSEDAAESFHDDQQENGCSEPVKEIREDEFKNFEHGIILQVSRRVLVVGLHLLRLVHTRALHYPTALGVRYT